MFERNDDVLFVCYDNQGYMNTGVQRSGATPPGASTANTRPVGSEPGNAFGQGKDLPRIAMAHEIPYVATATVADLHDLEREGGEGDVAARRSLPARAGAVPAGLGRRPRQDTVRLARLATQSGLFPVFEAEHGDGHGHDPDPTPRAGRGLPAPAGPLRAPVRPGPAARTWSPASRPVPTATSPGTASSPTGGA